MGEGASLPDSGLEFLLVPFDRGILPVRHGRCRWLDTSAALLSAEIPAARGKSRHPSPWNRPGRLRVGRAPPLEETIWWNADKPSDNVVKPEIGMSFDSLGKPTVSITCIPGSLDLV